jgi:hypothetical protein
MSTFLHQNVAFAPKYTKVRYIGFVSGKEFIGGLLEKAVQIEPVLGSCFGTPKVSHEEAASAKVVSKRWPKVPFHGASAF